MTVRVDVRLRELHHSLPMGAAKRRAGPGRSPKLDGKLARWIVARKRTRAQVAEQLGISVPFLGHICREVRRPSLDLAVRIERLTEGEVSVAYLAGLPEHTADR